MEKSEKKNKYFTFTNHNDIYIDYPMRLVSDSEIPDFIVYFEKPNNYNGEFGFDWFRSDYPSAIADPAELDDLKQEYTPEQIMGKEYLTPWISMYPNQKGVKIMAHFEFDDKKIKGKNIKEERILINTPAGVNVSPGEITIGEAHEKKKIELEIECVSPVSSNSKIEVEVPGDNSIRGKLNFYKNNEQKEVNILFVKVLCNNQYDNLTFGTAFDAEKKINKLVTELNANFLNQALIKVNNDGIVDMRIDVGSYVADGNILSNGDIQPRYNHKTISGRIYKDFLAQRNINSYRGIVLFFTSMHQTDTRAGQSSYWLRSPDINLFPHGTFDGGDINAGIIAHELGHALGLAHTFMPNSEFDRKIAEWEKEKNKKIGDVNKKLSSLLKTQEENNYPDNTKLNVTIEPTGEKVKTTFGAYKASLNNEITKAEQEYNQKIQDVNNVLRNYHPYIFNFAKTDNIMDYDGKPNQLKTNPYNRIMFNKWQWESMAHEIESDPNLE